MNDNRELSTRDKLLKNITLRRSKTFKDTRVDAKKISSRMTEVTASIIVKHVFFSEIVKHVDPK